MNYTQLTPEKIPQILPLYIDYYNTCEDGCWTRESAGERITQVLTMPGGWGLLLEEDDAPIGFAMGYFKRYDDLTSFVLEEIVVERTRQGRGLGTALLREVEAQVREQGAAGIELSAVNDAQHHRFYGRAGYNDAKNLVLKVKWFGH